MRRIIEVLPCSITDTGTDAVVNASNPGADLGGGVSRALSDECGGLVLQQEMHDKLDAEFDGELSADDCLVTSGGTSKRIRFVLHVPAVNYSERGKPSTAERIAACAEAAVMAAALLAEKEGPLAIAFPLLGAGSGHLPPAVSLKAMVDGMRRVFHEQPEARITRVVFAVPEPDRFALANARLDQLLVLR